MPTNIISSQDKIIWFLTFTFYTTLFFIGRNVDGSYYLAFIAGVILVFTGLKLQIDAFHIAIFQFALFCLLTIFWARNYMFAMEKATTLFKIFICMSVLYSYYSRRNDIDVLLKTILWSGYIVAYYAIIHYGPSRIFSQARLYNEFLNVNSLGMICSLTIIIHLFYYYFFKKYRDGLFFIFPLIILIGSTQSRKAIAMLVVGYMLLMIFKNRDHIKTNLLPILRILLIAIIVIIILLFLSHTDLFQGATSRVIDLIDSVSEDKTNLRKIYRELGWNQLKQTPILGIGMGNGRLLALEATNHDCYLHCNYAEIAACGGIVGLVSFYGIYLYIIIKEFKYLAIDKYAVIVLTVILCKLMTDWGAVNYASKSTYFLFMMYFSHLKICKRKYPDIK